MSSSNGNNGNRGGRREPMMPALEQVLRGRRVLVTGATGFLGKVFLYVLLRWHPELERLFLLIRGDRRSSQSRFRREILDSPVMSPLREQLGARFERYVEERIAVLAGDISDKTLGADCDKLARGAIDAVVHCAGLVNFDASLEKAFEGNTLGVRHMVAFCRRHRAALLHVSTCYVAGEADGHRYEDDIPENWCPNGRRGFAVEQEIGDALSAIERVQAESRDHARQADMHEQAADENRSVESREALVETKRKRWVEERLKEVGRQRSLKWGWPNTYSYTKSLGEQLVLAQRRQFKVAVVRPAVIESALRDPFPGWNQGVNTSAPLAYLSGRGYRFYPARGELVLDVVPVDVAAHAMVPVLGALLLGKHKPIYQLCTSDTNPFPMRRLVELTALYNRSEQKDHNGALGKLARHLEAVVVSPQSYELASRAVPKLLKRAAKLVGVVVGEESTAARSFAQFADRISDGTALARSLVEVYRPYIRELVYTFHARNVRELYARLEPADAETHPFRPELIDWAQYWMGTHLPGLKRHIFPQLEQHTRARPRGAPRHKTLLEMLDSLAERYGSRAALVARKPSGERTAITYRELNERARRGGLFLLQRGVKPGDRVLLIGENSPEWVAAYFAILAAGAVAVPLDPLVTADELAAICHIAMPAAALCSAPVRERLGPTAASAQDPLVELDLAELSRPFLLRRKANPAEHVDRRSLASIVFTSGTTGAPKGVMLTHGNFTGQIAMLARVFALNSEDVVLSLLPLHHTFEFTCGMLLPLASGATVVYPVGVDAANLARTLSEVRPTALVGVPALWEAIHRRIVDLVEGRGSLVSAAFERLRDLNRRLDRDFGANLGPLMFREVHAALGGRLKLAVSGGAALPGTVTHFFNDIGIRLLEGYGLTEAGPVLSVGRPDEPLRPGSVGRPLSGVELKLEGEEGAEVGEILARGPNIMSGYYRNQAATDEALREGWLHTGDLGRFDGEGRLYIVGRAKEVIIDSGGNNIYIDELEEVYGRSPYVREMAVVGLKVGQGEQVAALVAPAYAKGESRRWVEDQVRAHFEKVSAGLNAHKRIRIVRFTDKELPRTRTRKVKRADVVEVLRAMVERAGRNGAGLAADVEPWLAEMLGQLCAVEVEITATTRLIEDLGLDSLALAELAEHIEERSGSELRAEQLSSVGTVEDLQRLALERNGTRPRLPSYGRFAEPFTPLLPWPFKSLGEAAVQGGQRALLEGWLKPRILGRGNVASNRNLLVVANHASHFDFALVCHALGPMGRNVVVLAAKDYFFKTVAHRFIASNFMPLIPFDRERAQLESLDEGLAQLAAGRSVLMFPEGTRSPDGAVHTFKSGLGYLALRSGCDVLPILISGTHQVLGKGGLIPRHHPVEVRIGRVIANAELRRMAENAEGPGAYRKLADFMRSAVIGLAERPAPAIGGVSQAGSSAKGAHDAQGKSLGERTAVHARAKA